MVWSDAEKLGIIKNSKRKNEINTFELMRVYILHPLVVLHCTVGLKALVPSVLSLIRLFSKCEVCYHNGGNLV